MVGAELNDKLTSLLKALGGKSPILRVGIIGNPTEARIGAVHEFGTSTIPKRSFLRVPVTDQLGKRLESAVNGSVLLSQIIDAESLKPLLEIIGQQAVAASKESFDTSGDGHWPATERGNKPLVVTGALRDSVSFDIQGGAG